MATRHERVIVDLDDRFSRPMAGMAGNVSLFRRNIDDADGSLLKFDRHTQDVGRNIDKLSGRLGLFIDLAATLGPALIPAATALVPLMAGLSNQLGFAVIAGGSAILAFQGVGDALKAFNEQAVNPSAANLEKMHEAMAKLGPAGRDFVRELQAIRPQMQKLQDAAQAGLFPGMTEGIESLTTRLPQVEGIISATSDALGDLLANAGESLAGPQWDEFFSMIQSEARPTLMALGESIGQVTKGLAELWIAFAPMNREFSQGMLEASRSFADWADGLSATQGFQEFMAYLSETGPKVAEALGAIGGALLDVLEAAAPLGGPALAAITAFGNAISAIANSDIGTPLLAGIAVWRAYSMAVSLAEKAQMRFNASSAAGGAAGAKGAKGGMFAGYTASLLGVTSAQERAQTAAGKTSATIAAQRGAFAKGAAGAALLGLAMTGVADGMGLSNTAMLGLTGFMVGGGVGAALGATAGAALDLAHANDGLNDSLATLNAMAGKVDLTTFNAQLAKAKAQVDDLSNVTGVGDALSDTAKAFGGALKDPFSSFQQRKGDARASLADAQATQKRIAVYKELSNVVTAAATAQMLGVHGFQLTAAGAREAAMSVDQFTASMKGATAALGRQSNWDSFRTSVLDAKDAVADAGKTLQKNGDIIRGQGRDMQRAGLESRGMLRNIAANAVQTAEAMKNIGARTKFLDNARQSFVSVARSMGLSRASARALADQLGLLDRAKANPKVEEKGAKPSQARVQALRKEIAALRDKTQHTRVDGADEARAKIGRLRAEINSLRNRTVVITYQGVRTGATQPGTHRAIASGGPVYARFPGETTGPRDDTIPALLSHREFVQPVAAVDFYGERLMEDIRTRRLPRPAGYRDGGLVHFADGGSARRNNADDNAHHVNHFAAALREATKAVKAEKSARERLIGKRNDLSGTVRDQFLTDPFGETNVWAKGGGSPLTILKADIAKANAFKSTLAALKRQGLDGNAMAAIAATGDVGKAQALLSTGKAGVGQFEAAFNQRARAAASVGAAAGNAAYGHQITLQTREIRQLNRRIDRLHAELKSHPGRTGRAVADGVNHAASRAKRGKRG